MTKMGAAKQFLEQTLQNSNKKDCVFWPFSRNNKGYPWIRHNGKIVLAHRLMCELSKGKPPKTSSCALHSCNKGHLGCINPHHLRWGTKKENSEQMVRDGNSYGAKGSESPVATMTETEVKKIKRDLRKGMFIKDVAVKYNRPNGTIANISSGRNWGHVK